MISPDGAVLFMAHPGHEVLIHGWLSCARPTVHVLTDGSGHSDAGRIPLTRAMLRALGAAEGTIFGRFTDRRIYAAILSGDSTFLTSLASELADQFVTRSARTVVADAAEGYNPIHDLCRAIVGSACEVARRGGVEVRHYEYALADGPDSLAGACETIDLDDRALAAKMEWARRLSSSVTDVDELLARFGEQSFRRERFRLVGDWTADGFAAGERPRYERFGQERVDAGFYTRVIRHDQHIVPLRDALRRWVESTQCVF
jgi:hypothetical protein